MNRFWNALIAGHLLGLITLAACYFASELVLPPGSGISATTTVVVSFSAFVLAFVISFFLLPKNSKG